jgi:hypothetical protein
MNETRQSLLCRAQTGEAKAWKDLTDLYRPLILGWLNRQGVPARDLEDLSQDVLLLAGDARPVVETTKLSETKPRGSRVQVPADSSVDVTAVRNDINNTAVGMSDLRAHREHPSARRSR